MACVRLEGGEAVFSRVDDGESELRSTSDGPIVLAASAPGYASQRVELSAPPSTGAIEILLEPAMSACVWVEFDDGRPAAGARVEWRAVVEALERDQLTDWIDSRRRSAGAALETLADGEGRACVATGVAVLARVSDPSSGAGHTVRVLPGGEQQVVLSSHPLRVEFVDIDSRQPLAGLELDAWYPTEIDALAHALTTDAHGVAAIAASSYPILLRRPNASLWQSALVPLSAGMTQVGVGGRLAPMIRIDGPPPDGVLTVGVQNCGGLARFVDDISGEPIDALVRTTVRSVRECGEPGKGVTQCTAKTARCALQSADQVFAVERGLLRLHCLFPDAEKQALAGVDALEVVFAVAGYRPCSVPLAQLPGRGDAQPLEFRLTSSAVRTLRVVHHGGAPYRQSISIYAPDHDFLAWAGLHRDTGIHGPFDWFGGDLLVRIGESWEGARRIPAAQLEAEHEITLTLEADTGVIVVEGGPAHLAHFPLVAKLGLSLGGTLYEPVSVEGVVRRFEGLPAGSYMVGPRKWVESAELQSFTIEDKFERRDHATRVALGPGETVVVPWLDAWAATRERRGRVRVLPEGAAAPFIVPLYGPYDEEMPAGIQHMVFGRRTERLPLDRRGNYVIAAGDPLPLMLVVCVADDGQWGTSQGLHVLDTLRPGESLDIQTGSVELHWAGPATNELVPVRVEARAEDFRFPLSSFHNAGQLSWRADLPLRIDGIPLHVRSIEVKRRLTPVQLARGVVTRLDIDIDALEPKAR
jgi:hypothetical protein